jgi:hypothetical protein
MFIAADEQLRRAEQMVLGRVGAKLPWRARICSQVCRLLDHGLVLKEDCVLFAYSTPLFSHLRGGGIKGAKKNFLDYCLE